MMKLNLPSFRNYVVKCEQSLRRMPWLEMAMGHQIVDQIPINTTLAAFLSYVPGGTTGQSIALHYIMTRGLYDAAMGRNALAQKASQELGRQVDDDEIFSKEAHAHDPQLAAFWQQHKDEYFSEWEPQTIPTTRGREVSIAGINKILVSQGFKPFKFGDVDGFIEYAENGSWSFPVSHQSHKGQGEEHHKRNGIDLSHPKYEKFAVKDASGEEKYGYSFGYETKWEPPSQNDLPHYKSIIHDLKTRSGPEIQDILAGKETSPNHLLHGDEEGDAVRNFIRNAHQSGQLSQKTQDISPITRKGSLYYQCKDQEEFNELSQTIQQGLQTYNQARDPRENVPYGSDMETPNMQWSPEDLQQVEAQLFGKANELQIRTRIEDPIVLRHWQRFGFSQPRSYKYTEAFLKAGAKSRGITFNQSEFFPKANYKDYTGTPQYDKIPVVNPRQDIADFLAQGFVPANGQSIDDPNATNIRLKRHKDIIQFSKDPDGKWYQLKRVEGTTPYTKIEPSSMMLRGSVQRDKTNRADPNRSVGTLSTGQILATPAYGDALDKIKDTWFNNPEQYGDRLKGGIPVSILNAISIGMSRASKGLLMSREDISSVVGGENGLLGIAWSELDKLAAGWQFKFGVPGKEHKSKVETDIYGLLKKNAQIDDPKQAQAVVDRFNQIIRQREIVPDDFSDLGDGNAIYQAFLENGFYWRSSHVANRVDAEVKNIVFNQRKEGAGKTSKDSEGNATDMVSNAADTSHRDRADAAPMVRTNRLTRADKENAVTVDPLQNVLRNQQQQREADLKNRPFFNARRSAEVSQDETGLYRRAYDATQGLASFVDLKGAAQMALYKLAKGQSHGQEETKGMVDGVCDKVVQLLNGYLDSPNVLDPENVKAILAMYQTFIPDNARTSLVALTNATGLQNVAIPIAREFAQKIIGNKDLVQAIQSPATQPEQEAPSAGDQAASADSVSVRNPETGSEDVFHRPEDLKSAYDQTKRRYDLSIDKNSLKAKSLDKYMKDLYAAAIGSTAPANFRALFSTSVQQNLPQQAASNPVVAPKPPTYARLGMGMSRPAARPQVPQAPAPPVRPQVPQAPAPHPEVNWDYDPYDEASKKFYLWDDDDDSFYSEARLWDDDDDSFYSDVRSSGLVKFKYYKKGN